MDETPINKYHVTSKIIENLIEAFHIGKRIRENNIGWP